MLASTVLMGFTSQSRLVRQRSLASSFSTLPAVLAELPERSLWLSPAPVWACLHHLLPSPSEGPVSMGHGRGTTGMCLASESLEGAGGTFALGPYGGTGTLSALTGLWVLISCLDCTVVTQTLLGAECCVPLKIHVLKP